MCSVLPLKASAQTVGEGHDSLHCYTQWQGQRFVTTETISFLATFRSSLAEFKIKSIDGISALEWNKNVGEQSAGNGFGGI